jgi:calcium-translocating P-type ATPase
MEEAESPPGPRSPAPPADASSTAELPVSQPASDSLWHVLSQPELEAMLRTSLHGLTQPEAAQRLQTVGPNRVREVLPPSNWKIFLHQFQSPIIYVLLIANIVTLVLREYSDSLVIALAMALNTVVGFIQERRAERSVHALMQLVVPRARVIRDGREHEIDSAALVPGDLVILESGMRVPADIRLISATRLAIDESLLSGESVPVNKSSSPLRAEVPKMERQNMAYAGTTVARGRGRGYVVATGMRTLLGEIAGQISEAPRAVTPLQERMRRFALVITVSVIASAVIVFALGVALGDTLAHMFLVAVAMAVSAVPEGLPVAYTVTFAIGVRRMARHQAIIRHLPAVETLGSTTVIGSDKTGTLTENRMKVQEIWAGGRAWRSFTPLALSSDAGRVEENALYLTVLTGVLANEAELYLVNGEDGKYESRGDPTEVSLLMAAEEFGIEHETMRGEYAPVAEIPFEPEQRYSASFRLHNGTHYVFVKGAPENLISMCAYLLADGRAEPLDAEVVQRTAAEMAARGLRVLAMAYSPLRAAPSESVPGLPPSGLILVGMVGMIDPPRKGVREAIAGCQRAGIRVIMITGDHALTAHAIAQQLGIAGAGDVVLTGAQLESWDDAQLGKVVRQASVYARTAPEHKLRLVRVLQQQGEVVAITGDGMNDAPALHAADIGIAMGRSGTDVAREASDMVLADDNFVSIYRAVEQGRIVFDNLQAVTFFLVSTGAAEILTILISLAWQSPLPFLPAQILWLNVVTNGLQDVAMAFEPGNEAVLQRRPRSRTEGIVSRLLWKRTVLSGVVLAAGTLLMFHRELALTGSLARARTVALTTMVLFQMFQAGNARSETVSLFRLSPLSNPFLLVSTAAALGIHMVVVASSILVAVEFHKWFVRRGASTGVGTNRAHAEISGGKLRTR